MSLFISGHSDPVLPWFHSFLLWFISRSGYRSTVSRHWQGWWARINAYTCLNKQGLYKAQTECCNVQQTCSRENKYVDAGHFVYILPLLKRVFVESLETAGFQSFIDFSSPNSALHKIFDLSFIWGVDLIYGNFGFLSSWSYETAGFSQDEYVKLQVSVN